VVFRRFRRNRVARPQNPPRDGQGSAGPVAVNA